MGKDYTGLKYNKLTFIHRSGVSAGKSHTPLWMCRCDCGKEIIVAATDVVNGRTKSCGCMKGLNLSDSNILSDIIGRKYNNLTILGLCEDRNTRNRPMLLCGCDCGAVKQIIATNVINGRTKSCGCITATRVGDTNRTHGMSNTPAYNTWHGMIQRCHNKNNKDYARYGQRGIIVCEKWRNSFDAFILDMGYPDNNMTIDRINNFGNYEPNNCRWADAATQSNNRRNNRVIVFDGKEYNLCQLSKQLNISRHKLSYWISNNKDIRNIKK